MLLREFKLTQFSTFTARVKVLQPLYSQWIEVTISARNMQEAKQILLSQYGKGSIVTALRKSK